MSGDRERRWRATLPPEDAALWDYVTHDIEPVRGKARVRIRGGAPDATQPAGFTPEDWPEMHDERRLPAPAPPRASEPRDRLFGGKSATASGPAKPVPAPSAADRLAKSWGAGKPSAEPVRPVVLERRKSRKIARGGEEIEARLDLHGLTQDEAHRALDTFLWRCHADGVRTVIVITGKGGSLSTGKGAGRRDEPDVGLYGERERGVLRRMVPLWLDSADLRPIVIGFSAAHLRHGGGGALYVMLRRGR